MSSITPDLHTLDVKLVNSLLNLNQIWEVKCNLSDFFLREVIDRRVVLGDIVSKI